MDMDCPAAFGTHYECGFVVPLDGLSPLPVPSEPVNPVAWVEGAVLQKAQKSYSEASRVVLVVDLQWMPLRDFQCSALAERLRTAGVAFSEVWIVTVFDVPQRIW